MPTLILVRHAQSEKNALNIVSHDFHKPHHLTELGKTQARQVGTILKDTPITSAVTSRYPRTQETAKIILGNRQIYITIDERIDEIHNGVLEGETITAYHASIQDRATQTPEGGETWEELKTRLRSFLHDARKMEGTVLVVSHGHPIAVMRGLIGGWDDQRMETAIPHHEDIFRYEFPDG